MKKRTKKAKAKTTRRDIYQTQDAVCEIEGKIRALKREIANLIPKLEQALKVHQENVQQVANFTTEDAEVKAAKIILPHYSDDEIALALRHAASGVGHLLEVVELELPKEEVA